MPTVESLPTRPGLNEVPASPLQQVGFQLLVLAGGQTFHHLAGQREVLLVILGGRASFRVNDSLFPNLGGRPNVFAGKPHSVYCPPGSQVEIRAHGPLEVALVSAPSALDTQPYVIPPERVTSGSGGAANFSRTFHQILTLAFQPDLPAQRLIVGETYTPSGNWSTYPPHKHESDDLPRQARHEELYYFKIDPPGGFGLVRCYDDHNDTAYVARDNSILLVDEGYHTVVSAPGFTTYYLWALAGSQRTQAVVEDPQLAWVSRTVPMLKSLGH